MQYTAATLSVYLAYMGIILLEYLVALFNNILTDEMRSLFMEGSGRSVGEESQPC